MAIEKTIFTTTSQAANAPEVLEWLTANSAEYFDTVSADESGNITCTISGKTALVLGFDGTTKSITVYLDNGVSIEDFLTTEVCSYGVKTSYGLYLKGTTYRIFVTKSNNGGVGFVLYNRTTSASVVKYYVGDFYASKSIWAASANGEAVMSQAGDLTTISSIVCPGGTYLPNLFTTPFSEYLGTECILEKNNERYWYNGYIALKD